VRLSSQRVARLYLARKDREAVREAQDIYKALVKFLKTVGRVTTDRKGRPKVEGVWFLRLPMGLSIHFDFKDGETYYDNDGNLVVSPRMAWKYKDMPPVEAALKLLYKDRDRVIHELTHHVDRMRMGKGWGEAAKGYRTPDQDATAYFNDPREMNAYFHQGIDKVVAELDEVMPLLKPGAVRDRDHDWAVVMLEEFATMTFDEFFDRVKRGWPTKSFFRQVGFWEALTPKNKRRIKKRVYDLYAKLRKESRDKIRELQDLGDPSAQTVKL